MKYPFQVSLEERDLMTVTWCERRYLRVSGGYLSVSGYCLNDGNEHGRPVGTAVCIVQCGVDSQDKTKFLTRAVPYSPVFGLSPMFPFTGIRISFNFNGSC